MKLTTRLDDNVQHIVETFGNSTDLQIREIRIGGTQKLWACIMYIEGISDTVKITDSILQPLTQAFQDQLKDQNNASPQNSLDLLETCILTTSDVQKTKQWATLISSILQANASS